MEEGRKKDCIEDHSLEQSLKVIKNRDQLLSIKIVWMLLSKRFPERGFKVHFRDLFITTFFLSSSSKHSYLASLILSFFNSPFHFICNYFLLLPLSLPTDRLSKSSMRFSRSIRFLSTSFEISFQFLLSSSSTTSSYFFFNINIQSDKSNISNLFTFRKVEIL